MRKKLISIITSICVMGTLFGGCGNKSEDKSLAELIAAEEESKSSDDVTEAASNNEETTEEETESATEAVALGDNKTQLLMVYMVGSNLESESGCGSADLAEMVESKFDHEKLQVIVCTGGASKWWIEGISTDKCEVHEIMENNIDLKTTLENDNMAKKDTLTEFIDYGTNNYEADSYSLMLWNHGAGAVLGYGVDENHNNEVMSIVDLKDAILGSEFCKSGRKMEWIGFDACLMGMLEVADALSDCSGYMISSEEVVPGFGMNYSFLSDLSKAENMDGVTAGTCILDSFEYFYKNESPYPAEYTLSCIDLSKVGNVKNNWVNLINAAKPDLKNGGYSPVARKRDQALDFGKLDETGFYDSVDMLDIVNGLSSVYPQEAEKLKGALQELVIDQRSNMQNAGGVAIYFPYDNMDYAEAFMKVYEKLDFSDDYVEFLKEFTDIKTGDAIAEWDVSDVEPVADTSEGHEGRYMVQLSDGLIQNFARAKYSIWEHEEGDSYVMWTNSSDVELSEDGVLSAGFDGRIFYVGDSKGESLPCSAIEIEHNEDYSIYSIPIELFDLEAFEFSLAYVHFKVGKDYPDGVICGIYNTMDEEAGLYPDRTEVKIGDKTEIYPFIFAREIKFNDDGTVAPFDEWKSTSGMGKGITIKGEFEVTMKDAQNEDYCCIFQVHDTQGKSSFTRPIFNKR